MKYLFLLYAVNSVHAGQEELTDLVGLYPRSFSDREYGSVARSSFADSQLSYSQVFGLLPHIAPRLRSKDGSLVETVDETFPDLETIEGLGIREKSSVDYHRTR